VIKLNKANQRRQIEKMKPLFIPDPRTVWNILSTHAEVVYLEKHLDNIDWTNLSRNPGAIKLLSENPDKVIGHALCWNPSPEVLPLLVARIETERMNWSGISQHPSALALLEKYPEKIDWFFASYNPNLIPLLEKNIDKVEWTYVCRNDEITHQGIQFLEKHVDKLCPVCWSLLSGYSVAVPLLEKYPEHIDWEGLSQNPAAIHLLEPEKIVWNELSSNPNAMHLLFHLDTEQMKQENATFTEELMAYVFQPERLMRLSCQYDMDLRSYVKIY
jgi:hypothetical protein